MADKTRMQIKDLEEKIEKLEWFVEQVNQYFSDSLEILNLAIEGAGQLSQIIVDSNGNYYADGVDMTWFDKMKQTKVVSYAKRDYQDALTRTLNQASRDMLLSDDGDTYYREELKKRLKGHDRSQWKKIIDDYNHTLKIDNEGNLIEIFDNSAYKDRHYQKNDNFSVLKNGKYDSASTRMINEKYQELLQENFEANSAEFWGGVSQILSGLLLDFASVAAETGGLVLAPETGGASFIAGTTAAELALDAGNALILSGVVSTGSAISKTGSTNAEIQVNYSSNYDSWQANKPTSKTFGTVEGKVKGKKGNIRVDAEPHSGKVQIQSGGGKSGYRVNAHRGMDKIVDATSAREWIDDISELNKLSNYEKNQLVKYILKAVKWLKS
ncbi:virulence protein [Streptococcus parasanguinis]|uniref:virulence protein n=1 Tax=Streptococcus parasanguinis TaxID=1318 RepID=UPI00352F9774